MDALVLRDVTKRFGDVCAVEGLCASVPAGTVCGLIGPNGSGKTTTLRMVLDIFAPDAGTIEVFGRPAAESAKDRVGYLPEDRGLYAKMRVGEVLEFFARLKGVSPARARAEIPRWLERLDLGAWRGARVEELSKGMQQKLQFVATVIHAPDLLVLDEPFSGLDPVGATRLKDVVLELRRAGATIVLSTHAMEVAEKICDAVVMVHRGRKVLDGPLDRLLRDHGEGTVAIEYEGDGTALAGLPGVAGVDDYGRSATLRLRPDADTQALLRALVDRVRVRRFEAHRASLTEIFLCHAGGVEGRADA